MRRQLVVHVVGAQPNYMKVAPVYAALERNGRVEQRLIHTGQHYDRDINEVFFDELPLPEPHAQLRVGSGSHAEQTARALIELERLFVDPSRISSSFPATSTRRSQPRSRLRS